MEIDVFQWQILLSSDIKLLKLCFSAIPLPGSVPNLFLGALFAILFASGGGGGATFTNQSKGWYRAAG
jgi:hypothetical protein